MAQFYGGEANAASAPEFGAAQIKLLNGGGKIFEDIPMNNRCGNLTMMR